MYDQSEFRITSQITKRLESILREVNSPLKERLVLEALDNPIENPLSFLHSIKGSTRDRDNQSSFVHELSGVDIQKNCAELALIASTLLADIQAVIRPM